MDAISTTKREEKEMQTAADFSIGEKVLFGRSRGEQTLGEIIKKNPKRAKIKQLESRGTQKTHQVGTVWTVPYTLLTKTGADSATPTTQANSNEAHGLIPDDQLQGVAMPRILSAMRAALVGRRIVAIGYSRFDDEEIAPTLVLDDGTKVIAMRDDEGNGPGVLEHENAGLLCQTST
jgi:hypothetical protein